jgi:alpha-mannosidase
MPTPADLTIATYETFATNVIARAAIAAAATLDIGAFQSIEPVTLDVALAARYKPVALDWRWGPKWSTCWFKLVATPACLDALSAAARAHPNPTRLALRFNTDTEALLYLDNAPYHGLDLHHQLAELPASLLRPSTSRRIASPLTLHVEAACNHPFGVHALPWESADTKRRWESDKPATLINADLVLVDQTLSDLLEAFNFAAQLARELLPHSPPMHPASAPWAAQAPWQSSRAEQLLTALHRTLDILSGAKGAALAAAAPEALGLLRAAIASTPASSTLRAHAVGHAHIDTAWLWPLRETRRKCQRTFATVLRLMERDPGFTFLCTQAQQYAFIEQDSPALFRQIAKRIKDRRWEANGGMWVEPDCNVPSGESLCRQLLHGALYWNSRFGDSAKQTHLFLPDTFGFPAQLPQLMALAGLSTFITNKLSWNDTNPFPHTTFHWEGLDSTRVLAHQTPGNDYNSTLTPRELKRADDAHRAKHIPSTRASKERSSTPRGGRFLQPFGFGDGGGGPTAASLFRAHLAAECDGLPATQFSRTDDFCRALARDVASAELNGRPAPTHHGELYLEIHRGTLTTQAWLKHANRQAEDDLRLAELLLAGAPIPLAAAERKRAQSELDEAWKLVLLNQFHDILPGSSINWVYDDAREQHARVTQIAQAWIERGLSLWTDILDTRGCAEPVAALNPASTAAGRVIGEGDSAFVAVADAISIELVDAAQPIVTHPGADAADVTPVTIEADTKARTATLDNSVIRVTIDALGRITSLISVNDDAPAPFHEIAAAPMNELQFFDDHPRQWEAWDIDAATLDHPRTSDTPATTWEVLDQGPARAALRIVREPEPGVIVEQTIILETESPRVEIRYRIRTAARRTLLRASFPTTIRTQQYLAQTQFGHVPRGTNCTDPRANAQFEAPIQRWIAATDTRVGLAILNDHKFAGSARSTPQGTTINVTLLRSPEYPAPGADAGEHEFALALTPFAGPASISDVEAQAEQFHRPVIVRELGGAAPARRRSGGAAASGITAWTPVEIDCDPAAFVEVSALKFAEDGSGDVILRLAETAGTPTDVALAWNIGVKRVEIVDLIERPMSRDASKADAISHNAAEGETELSLRAFEVVTLRVRRA